MCIGGGSSQKVGGPILPFPIPPHGRSQDFSSGGGVPRRPQRGTATVNESRASGSERRRRRDAQTAAVTNELGMPVRRTCTRVGHRVASHRR